MASAPPQSPVVDTSGEELGMARGVPGVFETFMDHVLEPIQHHLKDPSVSEVMVNGPDTIYVERSGRLERVPEKFRSAQQLEAACRIICQYVDRRLTPEEPSVEARLPGGERVQIVQPPAARAGLCLAIRKFSKQKITVRQLVEWGSLTDEAHEFLRIAVLAGQNVIVSGGTGSGKTTLLNALSDEIPSDQRIIVIEDATELQLGQDHVVYFESKRPDRAGLGGASIRDLFRASLRMRPDRIVVGECRGGEALDMIQAMNTGHGGSMSTVHANAPEDALKRIETLIMMGEIPMPLAAIRAQVASAVDVIVQVARFHTDHKRRVTAISEVLPLAQNGDYRVQDVFSLTELGGDDGGGLRLVWSGKSPTFRADLRRLGLGGEVAKTPHIWRGE